MVFLRMKEKTIKSIYYASVFIYIYLFIPHKLISDVEILEFKQQHKWKTENTINKKKETLS